MEATFKNSLGSYNDLRFATATVDNPTNLRLFAVKDIPVLDLYASELKRTPITKIKAGEQIIFKVSYVISDQGIKFYHITLRRNELINSVETDMYYDMLFLSETDLGVTDNRLYNPANFQELPDFKQQCYNLLEVFQINNNKTANNLSLAAVEIEKILSTKLDVSLSIVDLERELWNRKAEFLSLLGANLMNSYYDLYMSFRQTQFVYLHTNNVEIKTINTELDVNGRDAFNRCFSSYLPFILSKDETQIDNELYVIDFNENIFLENRNPESTYYDLKKSVSEVENNLNLSYSILNSLNAQVAREKGENTITVIDEKTQETSEKTVIIDTNPGTATTNKTLTALTTPQNKESIIKLLVIVLAVVVFIKIIR